MTLTHRTYGMAESVKVKGEKFIADFGWRGIREFTVTAFDMGLVTADADLNRTLNRIRRKRAKADDRIRKVCGATYGMESFFDGTNAGNIDSCSSEEFYEAIGYIAKNVKFIEAQVTESKLDLFKEMFGNIEEAYIFHDSAEVRNQFRIDFKRTENIPTILENALVETNGEAKHITRSLFIEKLVRYFGFMFGAKQNVDTIRNIARENGFLAEFERGFAL